MFPVFQGSPATAHLSSVNGADKISNSGRVDAGKLIPPQIISPEYWKTLRDWSVAIAERSADGHSVRILDLNKALHTPEIRKAILRPELFQCFKSFYRDNLIRLNEKADLKSNPLFHPAMEIIKKMQDMEVFLPKFTGLGAEIMALLAEQLQDLSFLDMPVPVRSLSHAYKADIQEKIYKRTRQYFKERGFDVRGGEVNDDKLDDISETGTHLPYISGKVPEINWTKTLNEAMTRRAVDVGLGVDFNRTPFFLNHIAQDIADEIIKTDSFSDHPCTGNMVHGAFSHSLQRLFGHDLKVLCEPVYNALVDNRIFTKVFDKNPSINADQVITLPHPGVEGESIALINYESIMNGRCPDSFHSLLAFGMVSQLLEQSLNTEQDVLKSLVLMGLDDTGDENQNRENIKQKIREVRALEYAIIGAFADEGKIVALALALAKETHDDSLRTVNDILTGYPEVDWSAFPHDEVIQKMLMGTVKYYLSRADEFTVYKKEEVHGQAKLRELVSMNNFDPNAGYVVYPAGAKPPATIMVK